MLLLLQLKVLLVYIYSISDILSNNIIIISGIILNIMIIIIILLFFIITTIVTIIAKHENERLRTIFAMIAK